MLLCTNICTKVYTFYNCPHIKMLRYIPQDSTFASKLRINQPQRVQVQRRLCQSHLRIFMVTFGWVSPQVCPGMGRTKPHHFHRLRHCHHFACCVHVLRGWSVRQGTGTMEGCSYVFDHFRISTFGQHGRQAGQKNQYIIFLPFRKLNTCWYALWPRSRCNYSSFVRYSDRCPVRHHQWGSQHIFDRLLCPLPQFCRVMESVFNRTLQFRPYQPNRRRTSHILVVCPWRSLRKLFWVFQHAPHLVHMEQGNIDFYWFG